MKPSDYDRSGHQEMTPAMLAWEFMPIEQREIFLIDAGIASQLRPRFLRATWVHIPFDQRVKLLHVFFEWNQKYRSDREGAPFTEIQMQRHGNVPCFCGKVI